ncbi:MAG: DUF58 domain-containing protein [Planctomycetota bacterium]|nr:MAG: DUF58 domain-containing protein [Planctomycetota bacterium]
MSPAINATLSCNMAGSAHPSQLLSVETLAHIHSLDVAARAVVDGLNAGAHRSPFKGHSVDFADHRPYVPGDDLRHLDWKVLGRRDRLVLKRYEAETDFACTLIVDGSGSMAYQGDGMAMSKYRYAAIMAATLSYLTLTQQDRAGLVLFTDHQILEHRPAQHDQLARICASLEEHQPSLGTNTAKAIEQVAAPSYRRGLVVLLSDCFTDLEELRQVFDRLRLRGHDVALVWILDPQEVDLSVPAVSRFQGLEGDGELVAEPRALRQAYRQEVMKHRLALEKMCRSRRIAWVEAHTNQAPQHPLNELLMKLQHA